MKSIRRERDRKKRTHIRIYITKKLISYWSIILVASWCAPVSSSHQQWIYILNRNHILRCDKLTLIKMIIVFRETKKKKITGKKSLTHTNTNTVSTHSAWNGPQSDDKIMIRGKHFYIHTKKNRRMKTKKTHNDNRNKSLKDKWPKNNNNTKYFHARSNQNVDWALDLKTAYKRKSNEMKWKKNQQTNNNKRIK